MILIGESGSTKTCWVLLRDGKKPLKFTTGGMNPYVQKREQISETIKTEVCPYLTDIKPTQIFFYGAGCSTETNNKIVYSCLKSFFNKAKIEIEHDMLAASRAAFDGEQVIVSILGTGSNACLYDGKECVSILPSLGYVLGDEGSGAHMGKMLVRDFLYQRMPFMLREKLRVEYNFDREFILDHIYKLPDPNRWLASFSHFIREHIKEEYSKDLVKKSFREFFDIHISSLQNNNKKIKINAVGSIAFHYQDFLKEIAAEFGCTIGKIVKSPMDELVKYHIREQEKAEVSKS